MHQLPHLLYSEEALLGAGFYATRAFCDLATSTKLYEDVRGMWTKGGRETGLPMVCEEQIYVHEYKKYTAIGAADIPIRHTLKNIVKI